MTNNLDDAIAYTLLLSDAAADAGYDAYEQGDQESADRHFNASDAWGTASARLMGIRDVVSEEPTS